VLTIQSSNLGRGKRFFFPKTFTPNLNGYREFSPEIEQPEHEVDNSPPSSVEVKNDRNYTFTHMYAFIASTGVALLSSFANM
jgi:hypothetical protein